MPNHGGIVVTWPFWDDVKIYLRRFRERNQDGDTSTTNRKIISQLAWSWTGLVFIIALTLHFTVKPEHEGVIGEFLTGTGTILTAIWIIATFRMQMIDIAEQRSELVKQRQSMQRQEVLETYKAYKHQLDNLAKLIVVGVCKANDADAIKLLYQEQNDSEIYSQIICNNKFDIHNLMLQRLAVADEYIMSTIDRYLRRYDTLKYIISTLDADGIIRDALLTDSQISDLYIALSSVKDLVRPMQD